MKEKVNWKEIKDSITKSLSKKEIVFNDVIYEIENKQIIVKNKPLSKKEHDKRYNEKRKLKLNVKVKVKKSKRKK